HSGQLFVDLGGRPLFNLNRHSSVLSLRHSLAIRPSQTQPMNAAICSRLSPGTPQTLIKSRVNSGQGRGGRRSIRVDPPNGWDGIRSFESRRWPAMTSTVSPDGGPQLRKPCPRQTLVTQAPMTTNTVTSGPTIYGRASNPGDLGLDVLAAALVR